MRDTVPGVRVTAIISTYNEADIIGQVVGDLVGQGIAVHVLDDGSTDGTLAALESLRTTGLVTTEHLDAPMAPDGTSGHSWTATLSRKETLARQLDTDWVIHHDADEFRESPWRQMSLANGIALVDRLGYNAINFALLNFWPTHDRYDPAVDIRTAFTHYEPGGSFDALQVKCWKKAPDIDLVSSGGHDAQFAGRRVFPVPFLLRHYPVRGQAHGLRKVLDERQTRFSAAERAKGWHVQYAGIDRRHNFLRESATLRAYDPDRTRAELLAAHVAVLAERASVLAAERDASAGHMRDLEAQLAEADRLRAQADTAAATLRTAHRELERGYHALEATARDLERQLGELKQSWSWALTAPLRALWPRRAR
jgi:hypothetical protein